MIVWLVQRFVKGIWDERKQEWDDCVFKVTGIFDNEQKAIDACRDHNNVISPIELNYRFLEERVNIPGAYYPLAKDFIEDGDNKNAKE
ncbi:hypothetical protein SOV_50940 [Sporomusa ovata DSM 2662]|uniref:Uncharacterized protein n=1 Tax=Sporomusa ovata TaxID=2378 RepID=A0A0U1L0X2_9FIRM|nr:hypothetical protein [Sporomusa ovata]EQB27467.1 hypothetical protein SOV_2c03630 [Sporomusa ovata DSM 2662]CQR73311.1 hypothetical protein SpAn4DRAFT_2543 [Sporomusa ovata]